MGTGVRRENQNENSPRYGSTLGARCSSGPPGTRMTTVIIIVLVVLIVCYMIFTGCGGFFSGSPSTTAFVG